MMGRITKLLTNVKQEHEEAWSGVNGSSLEKADEVFNESFETLEGLPNSSPVKATLAQLVGMTKIAEELESEAP